MNELINYFIEANAGLVFILFLYWLVLRNENHFAFSRSFLIAGIFSSLLFPFIHYTITEGSGIIPSLNILLPTHWLPEVTVNADEKSSLTTIDFVQSFWMILKWAYLVITFILTVRFIVTLSSIIKLLYQSDKYLWNNCSIIESDEDKPTFSFFNFIFIGRVNDLATLDKEKILQHELVHVQKAHSFDIILINLVAIVFWFNPFIIIYKKILVQLHEFEADARPASVYDVNSYCNLLARVALQSADYPIANHFNNSLTLKRIQMIKTMKKRISVWKILGLIPATTALFLMIGFQEQVMAQAKKQEPATASKDVPFTVVEQMPEYPGGMDAMIKLIQKELSYPAEARKKGIQGTTYVEMVIEKDGSMSRINAVKGFDDACDKEALRVIKLFPKWIPGKQSGEAVAVKYVLPIKFKI